MNQSLSTPKMTNEYFGYVSLSYFFYSAGYFAYKKFIGKFILKDE